MNEDRPGIPWDEMTLRQRDQVWRRSDVLETAKHAVATADNEARPWALREYARNLFKQCSDILLFSNDPERHIVMVPATFYVAEFYQMLVKDTLARLPDLTGESYSYPIRVAMARRIAQDTDDGSYSVDFRMECLTELQQLLEALETEARQHLSVVES